VAEVAPLVPCPPASRRRLTFAVRKTAGGVVLGFNQALSHHIVPVESCPIAVPAIESALGDLHEMASAIAATPKPFRLTVTATASGLDLAAEGSGRLSDASRLQASRLVREKGFARLAIDGEVVIEPRRPLVSFGGVPVAPPPGAFLQAVAEADEAMAALVSSHLAGARKLVDLFAGCGTFALRLAQGAAVHAVESDRPALAALDGAARNAGGLKPVSTEARDLFRRPLLARELDAFGGLVFDPPRAGAEAQSREIARSRVPLVAAVSCNPTTLARDLAILIEGGYKIMRMVPIDQFLWSPHVEVVALLEKVGKRR
jgi:23S rRNA (uracil1939-C5)-methyltransferase